MNHSPKPVLVRIVGINLKSVTYGNDVIPRSVIDWLWIPDFDTILKSWNDLCSSSVIFRFHLQLHLKSPSRSNSQSQSFPYILSKIFGLLSSSDSIPCHFNLLQVIPKFLTWLWKSWNVNNKRFRSLNQKLFVNQLWNDSNGIMIRSPKQKPSPVNQDIFSQPCLRKADPRLNLRTFPASKITLFFQFSRTKIFETAPEQSNFDKLSLFRQNLVSSA